MSSSINLDCRLNKQNIKSRTSEDLFLSATIESSSLPRADYSGGFQQPSGLPVNVCLVIDTSGSMREDNKLEHAKEAALQLSYVLSESDFFSLVSFAGRVRKELGTSNTMNIDEFENKVRQMHPDGNTNIYGGLETAYKELSNYSLSQPNYVHRIILLTDGQATAGKRRDSDFLEISQKIQASNISIIALGLGYDYNEDLLALLANNSDGIWHHVVNPVELARMFTNKFEEMKTVIMTKPKLQFKFMSGAEFSEIYKVKPMLTRIEDITYRGDIQEVSLSDLTQGKSQDIVFKIHVPARDEGMFRIANIKLVSGGAQEVSNDITINYTTDPIKYEMETDPYPRLLLQSTQSTVMLREGISNNDINTIIRAQTKLRETLSDPSADTVIRANPTLNEVVTVTNKAIGDTVVRMGSGQKLAEGDKKTLKSETTVIT